MRNPFGYTQTPKTSKSVENSRTTYNWRDAHSNFFQWNLCFSKKASATIQPLRLNLISQRPAEDVAGFFLAKDVKMVAIGPQRTELHSFEWWYPMHLRVRGADWYPYYRTSVSVWLCFGQVNSEHVSTKTVQCYPMLSTDRTLLPNVVLLTVQCYQMFPLTVHCPQKMSTVWPVLP